MKITKIFPRGFCKGVVDAWSTIEKFAKNNVDKKIYMIGWFVHNEHMVKHVEDLGIITLHDDNKTRYEIIADLEWTENSVVIFSSHGTDYRAIDLAHERKFFIIDTTCVYVKKIQDIVKEKIKEKKKIVFFGKKSHPESISIKALDYNFVYVCETIEEVKKTIIKNPNNKWFFTNQTTIGLSEYKKLIDYLNTRNDLDIEIKNDICDATNERQEALNKLRNVDLLIVVGDNRSNNSKKLCEAGLQKGIESILIADLKKLDSNVLNNKNHIAITSGASTPTWITSEVIKYVESKKNK